MPGGWRVHEHQPPGQSTASPLLGPGTVWQAAVAVMLVLLFAYLLISLSSRTLAIFTGEA
jgi:hypothetical protein